MYRVVFLDDTGPRRTEYYEDNFSEVDDLEFLSLPFRVLTGYARKDSRLERNCEFIRVPVSVPRPEPASLGMARHADTSFAIRAAECVLSHAPDMIAVSLYAWSAAQALRVVELCNQMDDRAVIVAGGPDVLGEAKQLLEAHPAIRVAVEGDGEEAFVRLLRHFCLGETRLPEVPSIVYRDGDAIRHAERIEFLTDLDAIPSTVLPYTLKEITRGRICYYEASRGCPNRCTYCQFSKGNRKVRSHSIGRVMADLAHMRKIGVRRITFVEPMFTLNVPRAEEILRYLLEEYAEAQVFVEMNLDRVPASLAPLLRAMLDAQRMFCGVGVQSTNPETLANVGRRSDLSALKANAKALFQGGLRAEYQVMAGLPGDTFQDILATLDYGYDMLPGLCPSIFPVMVLPGTPLRSSAAGHGVVYDPQPPYYVVKTGMLSAEDMQKVWVLYRIVPRLVAPMAAFAKTLGIDLPFLYRELFAPACFRYTDRWGFHDVVADLFYIGRSLREYLLDQSTDSATAGLLSENVDLLTVLSPEYDGTLSERFLDLPSRVSLTSVYALGGDTGRSLRMSEDMLGVHAFFFPHFQKLDAANHIYLEKCPGEYIVRGEKLQSAYCVLTGRNKIVFGIDCVQTPAPRAVEATDINSD